MIIAVSDLHLGTDECNKEEFMRFLRHPVWADATELVLCGDIFDFWRGSIADVLIESADVLSELKYMHDELEIKITFIAGNHDWILQKVRHPEFKFSTFYQIEEGSTKYTFIHGWESDPIQKRKLFAALCYTDNHGGEFLNQAWNAYVSYQGALRRVYEWIRKTSTKITLGKMLTPKSERDLGWLFSQDLPVTCTMEGDVTVCGHTHNPGIEDNIINCGSWVGINKNYVTIDGNIATVQEFK